MRLIGQDRVAWQLESRQARIVEMRFFGGLSEAEVGAVLELSRATVTRDWQAARVWLYRRMTRGKNRTDER
jgi:DNA-directed RNA polymerase specialized sigma24 family protein